MVLASAVSGRNWCICCASAPIRSLKPHLLVAPGLHPEALREAHLKLQRACRAHILKEKRCTRLTGTQARMRYWAKLCTCGEGGKNSCSAGNHEKYGIVAKGDSDETELLDEDSRCSNLKSLWVCGYSSKVRRITDADDDASWHQQVLQDGRS